MHKISFDICIRFTHFAKWVFKICYICMKSSVTWHFLSGFSCIFIQQLHFFFFWSFLMCWLSPLAAVNMDYAMEGTNVALAVFIPTAVILVVVLGIYIYFAKWVLQTSNLEPLRCRLKSLQRPDVVGPLPHRRLQGKTIRMPTASPPYDNMTEESAFDNPVYESGVSTDATTSVRDVDSQNTSVLSWSTVPPNYLLVILSCHLTVRQQRAL